MATEIVEYRPGHWVKVVDGRITGRATIEEVQAWHDAQRSASVLPPDDLTLDVDLSSTMRGAEPAQSLDVPLRPAYQRRARPAGAQPQATPAPGKARPQPGPRPAATPVQPGAAIRGERPTPPAQPGPASKGEPPKPAGRPTAPTAAQPAAPARNARPTPAAEGPMTAALPGSTPAREARPQPAERSATPPAQPKAADAGKPRPSVRQLDATVRASGVSVRQPKPGIPSPAAVEPGTTVLIRRKAKAEPEPEPTPAPEAADNPSTEVSPLLQRKPTARAESPAPSTSRRAAAPETAATPAPEPEAAVAQVLPSAEEADPIRTSPSQGPTYWWIWNADRQPIDAFLREWGLKYQTKFGHEMTFVFCSEGDQPAVEASGFDCDVSPLLRAGHFYLSHSNGKKNAS